MLLNIRPWAHLPILACSDWRQLSRVPSAERLFPNTVCLSSLNRRWQQFILGPPASKEWILPLNYSLAIPEPWRGASGREVLCSMTSLPGKNYREIGEIPRALWIGQLEVTSQHLQHHFPLQEWGMAVKAGVCPLLRPTWSACTAIICLPGQ